MEVCAWSENLNLSHANELGILPMSKEDLLKNSDIISIHLVLGERYKNLITKKEIEMMKMKLLKPWKNLKYYLLCEKEHPSQKVY